MAFKGNAWTLVCTKACKFNGLGLGRSLFLPGIVQAWLCMVVLLKPKNNHQGKWRFTGGKQGCFFALVSFKGEKGGSPKTPLPGWGGQLGLSISSPTV